MFWQHLSDEESNFRFALFVQLSCKQLDLHKKWHKHWFEKNLEKCTFLPFQNETKGDTVTAEAGSKFVPLKSNEAPCQLGWLLSHIFSSRTTKNPAIFSAFYMMSPRNAHTFFRKKRRNCVSFFAHFVSPFLKGQNSQYQMSTLENAKNQMGFLNFLEAIFLDLTSSRKLIAPGDISMKCACHKNEKKGDAIRKSATFLKSVQTFWRECFWTGLGCNGVSFYGD